MKRKLFSLLSIVLLLCLLTGAALADGVYYYSGNYPLYVVDSLSPYGYCYMYDRPTSTWGENLGRYDNGDEFVMLNWDANENYALVCSTRTGKQGYVSKSSLVKKGQQSNNQTATVRSELGYIYLYDRPTSTWGENLGRYDNGEVVNVISWRYNDNYAKVTTADGKMGYMLRSRLSLN